VIEFGWPIPADWEVVIDGFDTLSHREVRTLKNLLRVILMLFASAAGLFAVFAIGYGILGVILVLSSTDGGFVGEKDFYASALFLPSHARGGCSSRNNLIRALAKMEGEPGLSPWSARQRLTAPLPDGQVGFCYAFSDNEW
jgi:hypothetical protein